MAKSYGEMVEQIEKLQAEANALKRKEMDSIIKRIREAISTYGLTAADLGLKGAGKRGRPAGKTTLAGRKSATKKTGAARGAKFRDPSGNTWGGRGPRPQWLRDALASGRKLEDFAV